MKVVADTEVFEGGCVWRIEIPNNFATSGKTLLLSKVSEALNPKGVNNVIGPGGSITEFLRVQKRVAFIVNGGFNHYRKDFYTWPHTRFEVGDPVGLVKIRDHYFEDVLEESHYGFFVQEEKGEPWKIVRGEALRKTEKYILGCTPLLIEGGGALSLPKNMEPVPEGTINPPSYLGHGVQRHARTAVGLKEDMLVFLVVEDVDGQGGCTLAELQAIGLRLGLDALLNLDGGGSSQFRALVNGVWVQNKVHVADQERVLGNVIVLFDDSIE